MSADPIRGLGYRGQRFEVHGITHQGSDITVGWTNAVDGGGILTAIENMPLKYREAKIVDLRPGIDKVLKDWRQFKGCRKCFTELMNGKDVCPYCHQVFPEKRQP